MSPSISGRRISYDRFWGALLLLTCVVPYLIHDGDAIFYWDLIRDASNTGNDIALAWLVLGGVAGLVALVGGILGSGGAMRHVANLVLGGATLGVLLFSEQTRSEFSRAHFSELVPQGLGRNQWIFLVGILAAYIGSGIRVARPRHIVGVLFGGLGSAALGVSLFLPGAGGAPSVFDSVVEAFRTQDFSSMIASRWTVLIWSLCVAGAALLGTFNFFRTPAEVGLAKAVRFLVLGSFLVFFVAMGVHLTDQGPFGTTALPYAWSILRLLGPFFLCIDGLIAWFALVTLPGEADE